MTDLYLSRLVLPRVSMLKAKIVDEYDIHKLVYSMFPSEEKRNFLYYLDYGGLGNVQILVQSQNVPKQIDGFDVRTKVVPGSYFERNRYAFLLRFCPLKKKNGKPIRILHGDDDVKLWLEEREEKLGIRFDCDSLEKVHSGVVKMPHSKSGDLITLTYVDVKGVFNVFDRELFHSAVIGGVGPHKGFGMGMLQIRPIGEE